ncbi:aconitate hydratase [Candidatus Micrarchaeota archaeon]|nr:aconitate hydratase [Candidatus Micrarchaeota archaeon]
MGRTLAEKILRAHVAEGEFKQGNEVGIRIDQTLTQDATGTMACLQFEAMRVPRVKTELSVSYVDHNTLQTGFENADDHVYLQSVASKHGILFSRPGNGICHQVHLERFAVPGKTLLGSDSHTPTAGGMGSIAIGAGGLDVAVAMAGGLFYLKVPKIVGVKLSGKLPAWVSAKDVVLELLRRVGVKGGVGKIFEYFGEGVKTLSVPERATVTNMGAETGATNSIFPSDENTKDFLKREGREKDWVELNADVDAQYDEVVEIDLSSLEPLVAQPHSPGSVVALKQLAGKKVDQVLVGSCTNSSFKDLMIVAKILKGRKVHARVSFGVAPGSRQVLEELARNGALADLVNAGARIFESACGPCIGMGQAPTTDAVSLRTFNRNFEGRSGTKSAQVFLVSPEVAAVAALKGEISDPRELGEFPEVKLPTHFILDDSMILPPAKEGVEVEVVRGPNIKAIPDFPEQADEVKGRVLIKVGDDVTTDHIMPAGAKILPLRSNLPAISEHVFTQVDASFAKRAKEQGGGFVVGGENYGQGSSREHAALAPKFLGVKGIIAKSFARIHKANLVNFGILPLVFADKKDYESIAQGDELEITGVRNAISSRSPSLAIFNKTKNNSFKVVLELGSREAEMLLAGGLFNCLKNKK